MNTAAELRATMESFSDDVTWELLKRGFNDPEALRVFANSYGEICAQVPLEEGEAPGAGMAASLVGGFLLGLDYCQRRKGASE